MKKNKKKRGKMAGKIAVLSILSIILASGITILVLLVFTDVFTGIFPSAEENTGTNGYMDYILDNDGQKYNLTGINAEYTGIQEYAGSQISSEDFSVMAEYSDGSEVEVTDYSCDNLTEDYRLVEGSNNFIFRYGNYSSIVSVNAKNARELITPPDYILHKVDKEAAEELINQIDNGSITYAQAFSGVAFTGDSQIKALATNGIFTMQNIVAEIGESISYFEANYSEVVNIGTGKSILIVHYGINTLSESQSGNEELVARYRTLLERLKNDLPDTRIVVSGIFPVANTILYSKPRFMQINNYDFMLYEMCQELGIEYLSDNEYLTANQNYFSNDGLHLTREFYTDYWLKRMITVLGIS